jgi:hypothetical protein
MAGRLPQVEGGITARAGQLPRRSACQGPREGVFATCSTRNYRVPSGTVCRFNVTAHPGLPPSPSRRIKGGASGAYLAQNGLFVALSPFPRLNARLRRFRGF